MNKVLSSLFHQENKNCVLQPENSWIDWTSKDWGQSKASRYSLNEKACCFINNQSVAMCITVTKMRICSNVTITLFDFDRNWSKTEQRTKLFIGRMKGYSAINQDYTLHIIGKDYEISLQDYGFSKRLYGHIEHFDIGKQLLFDFTLSKFYGENDIINSNMHNSGDYLGCRKNINCFAAEGRIEFDETEFLFAPINSVATYEEFYASGSRCNSLLAGAASGLINGERFGIYITHDLGEHNIQMGISVILKGRIFSKHQSVINPIITFESASSHRGWHIISDDNNTILDFYPTHSTSWNDWIGIKKIKCNLVWGIYSGIVQSGSGLEIQINNLVGFQKNF
jgi:hypothetical protein